ncbi:MAG: 4Fe-4S binding protein [Candidatus Bathyarchaeia archaeon]|jgi:Fe-S-cluster-containing hydrogenase component 2
MVKRNIVKIDETKCNGCGACIPNCAEGALKIINGKARLVKDIYCDGLGACLGNCPQDAITIIQREADEFNEKAAQEHMKTTQTPPIMCPSVKAMQLENTPTQAPNARGVSRITNWPYQLKLLPPNAPFFQNADLLIAADCVPFAYANFHEDMLKGKILAIGCPKLDDATLYRNKLAEIFRSSNIKSISIVNMEVPCCFGLTRLVKEALELSGKSIPVRQQTISIKGEILTEN